MIDTLLMRLSLRPEPAFLVLLFFAYAFLGNIMECLVLSAEKRQMVLNRGFVRHLPFCIIYGFGALLGYALLLPFEHSYLLLFIVGALGATAFEYFVAMLQVRMFGDFWWDYTNKPFNYKGILCLESTLGWGVLAIVIVKLGHKLLAGFVSKVPPHIATTVAVLLVLAYVMDFAFSARQSYQEKQQREAGEQAPGFPVQEEVET